MKPTTSETKNSTSATQNRIFALSVAVPATPPKPNNAATTATIRKPTAQYSRLPNLVSPTLTVPSFGRLNWWKSCSSSHFAEPSKEPIISKLGVHGELGCPVG